MKVKGLVFFLTALLLLATPVMAVHSRGNVTQMTVATDEEQYYLLVVGNSDGIYGSLFKIVDNSWVKNFTISTKPLNGDNPESRSYSPTLVATAIKDPAGDYSTVRYVIVWLSNDGIWYKVIGYNGDNIVNITDDKVLADSTSVEMFSITSDPDNMRAVVIYEGRSSNTYNDTYYAIIEYNGTLKGPWKLDTAPGAVHYSKIAYNPNSKYFAIVRRYKISTSNYNLSVLMFKIDSGGNVNSLTEARYNMKKGYALSIAPNSTNGFIVVYRDGYSPYDIKSSMIGPDDSSFNWKSVVKTNYCYAVDIKFVKDKDGRPYFLLAFENETRYDSQNRIGYYVIGLAKLNYDGTLNQTYYYPSQTDTTKRYRFPILTIKPPSSPETYIVSWFDGSNNSATVTEYLPDFTEVSESTPVPFFSNLAIATATLLGILWLFRRR